MLHTVIQTTRPPFLLLTPVCVLLGVAPVEPLAWSLLSWVLLGALLAHVSVNCINEYQDYHSGLDHITERTPFSGGSGGLIEQPGAVRAVWALAWGSLVVCAVIGLWLVARVGWPLMAIGALGVLLVITYTQWLNRLPWLCLVAPGLGFGPLMGVGSYLAVGGQDISAALMVSLVPFFLVNNLLLLNQFPDIHADRQVGRRTLPIAYGTRFCAVVYGVFAAAAYGLISLMVVVGHWPVRALTSLITVPLALFSGWVAWRQGAAMGRQPRALGSNVVVALFTPSLLAWALFY